MREIKYQVWDKALQEMHEVLAIDWDSKGRPITCHTKTKKLYQYFKESDCAGFILRQFIGLKDREGKMIFEGDILQDSWTDEMGEVTFYEGAFCPGFGFRENWGIQIKESIVIGNIYSNPELLTNEKV